MSRDRTLHARHMLPVRQPQESRFGGQNETMLRRPRELASSEDSTETETSLGQFVGSFIRIIRRRWHRVALIWLAVATVTAIYSYTVIPEYRSSGAVQVSKGSNGSNPLAEFGLGGGKAEVATEVEIIKRHEFTAEVLRKLGLHVVEPDEPKFTLSPDIIFGRRSPINEQLRRVRSAVLVASVSEQRFTPVKLKLTVTDPTKVSILIEGDTERELKVGELLDTGDFMLQFGSAPLEVGDAIELAVLPEAKLLRRYESRISVKTLGTHQDPTNIVEVSVTHRDRSTAQAIVGTLINLYLQRTLEHQTKSASQTASFIETQLEEVRSTLRSAEQALLEFSQDEQAVQLDTQAKVAIESAAGLETRRITAELQERTIGTVLDRLERRPGEGAASLTSNFFEDPVLAGSIAQLTAEETKYETLKASLTPDHPTVLLLQQTLEFQRKNVIDLLKSARRNLSSQRTQLERELSTVAESMKQYPDKQLELARLTRDMTVSERLYILLLEKLEEAEILKASTTTDKRIVDPSSLPDVPTSPKRTQLLAFGALVGLIIGLSAALLAHYRQSRLETVEAVREVAALPVYGTVPRVDSDRQLSVQTLWAENNSSLVESFRALAVSVSLVPGEAGCGKLIVVTSCQPGEGKSTIAGNLAEAISRSGKKVLLLDLDLRRPTQHRAWGAPRAPGYTDLLATTENSAFKEIGSYPTDSRTKLLTAGTRVADTVAAVMTPSLEQLLNVAVAQNDFVLIDCPPAFVAETPALARFADLLMLVARPGVTERYNLLQALDVLGGLDVSAGLVLNAVGKQHSDQYYGYHYNYYYSRDYGRDSNDRHAA